MKSIENETDPICRRCIRITGLAEGFYKICQKYKDQCPCISCVVAAICIDCCDDLLDDFDIMIEKKWEEQDCKKY
jgi:hypothetical protein